MFNLPYDFSFPSRFKIKKIEESFTFAASSRTGIFFFLFTDVQGLTKAFSALVMDILNRNIPLEMCSCARTKLKTGKKFQATVV